MSYYSVSSNSSSGSSAKDIASSSQHSVHNITSCSSSCSSSSAININNMGSLAAIRRSSSSSVVSVPGSPTQVSVSSPSVKSSSNNSYNVSTTWGWWKSVLLIVFFVFTSYRLSVSCLHYIYPHAHYRIRDLLINQEMLPIPQSTSLPAPAVARNINSEPAERVLASNFTTPTTTATPNVSIDQIVDYVSKGRQRAAQSSVTFLGVAKDVGYYLPRVLQQIEGMASFFPQSQAILVEGDSLDNTAQLMAAWKRLSPANRTILSYSVLAALDTVGSFNGSIMPREGRLSLARNRALDALKQHVTTDYIIMVDLDIVGVSLEGFLDSFGRDGWMGMCAHGVILGSLYRDTYAFRMPGLYANHHKCGSDHLIYGISHEEKSQNRKLFEGAKAEVKRLMDYTRYLNDAGATLTLDPIVVDSCFGGLAIYKTKAIQDCRYHYRESTPPYMLDCEHVFFHQCLREHNPQEKMMSNPYMKLWYGHANLRAAGKFVDNLWRRSS